MICFVWLVVWLSGAVVETNDHPLMEIPVDNPEATHRTVHNLHPERRYRFSLRGRTAVGDGEPLVREGSPTLDGGTPAGFDLSFLFAFCV